MQLPIEREIEISLSKAVLSKWEPFSLEQISLYVPRTVYPPREDTNLLDETLAGLGAGAGRQLLEIGCGCGAISIAAVKRGWSVYSCDVNPLAIAATMGNAIENECSESIQASEGGPGEGGNWQPKEGVDVIAWNMPYLDPISANEERLGPLEDAGLIDSACGIKLLAELQTNPELLRKGGVVLLLHSSNKIGKELSSAWRKAGWATRIQNEAVICDEKLTVIAAWRPFEAVNPIILDECESTNTEILDSKCDIGQLIISSKQTQGRGQNGKQWVNSKDGFMGSWSIDINSIEKSYESLQIGASVAILDSFSAVKSLALPSHSWTNAGQIIQEGFVVKWPNDIFLNLKSRFAKLGGVLAESRSKGAETRLAIGIGLNRYGPDVDVETAGWNDVIGLNSMTNELLFPILHASMSSIFEMHPLVRDSKFEDILSTHYNLMRESYYYGKSSGLDALGLNQKGHLLTRGGVIESPSDLAWHWD